MVPANQAGPSNAPASPTMLPQSVLDEFLIIPSATTDENEWNGAWNVLLNKYFPFDDGWVIKPQVNPRSKARETVDFGVLFKIEHRRIPVMIVQIKPLPSLGSLSARGDADHQMRYRFRTFYDASPTVFTGISAFGHIVCKYELDKNANGRVAPEEIPEIPNIITDIAPRSRWDVDLTTPEGAAQILNIFQGVKDMMLNEAGYV